MLLNDKCCEKIKSSSACHITDIMRIIHHCYLCFYFGIMVGNRDRFLYKPFIWIDIPLGSTTTLDVGLEGLDVHGVDVGEDAEDVTAAVGA